MINRYNFPNNLDSINSIKYYLCKELIKGSNQWSSNHRS